MTWMTPLLAMMSVFVTLTVLRTVHQGDSSAGDLHGEGATLDGLHLVAVHAGDLRR